MTDPCPKLIETSTPSPRCVSRPLTQREEEMVAYTIKATMEDLRKRDIVEVVRCVDCWHGEPDDGLDSDQSVNCAPFGMLFPLDHFCAKGKRKP